MKTVFQAAGVIMSTMRMRRTACLLTMGVVEMGVTGVLHGAPRFEYHRIAEVGMRMGQTSLVDMDNDGDLDICTKPWNGNLHIHLRHMLVEDKHQALHI
jgi:hypothetical protein